LSEGYSIVYDKGYFHYTTSAEIDAIRRNCGPKSVLCVGGRDSTTDILVVYVCGLCEIITLKTSLNQPNYHNYFYWYNTPNYTFGYSPSANISQAVYTDVVLDSWNDRILSWNLDNIGGNRLGTYLNLGSNTRYYKIILKKF
jgi:hypothetical protein